MDGTGLGPPSRHEGRALTATPALAPDRKARNLFQIIRAHGGLICLLGGLAVLVAPTLRALWKADLAPDGGGQFLLVAIAIGYLLWRERDHFRLARAQPLWPGIGLFALLLPAYVLAWICQNPLWQLLATLAIVLLVGWPELGFATLRHFWFPASLSLFLGTPASGVVDAVARGLKLWLPQIATLIAQTAGLRVGATGAIIQVDGYQLQVANACSGVNSLMGIAGISLFYVYLRRGSEPLYAMLLCIMLAPVAILANLARIMIMIGVTHWFGDAPVSGPLHPLVGMSVFAFAVGVLFALDTAIYPLMRGRR